MTARPGQATKTQDLSFRTRPPSRQDRPSETVSSRIKKSKIAQNVLHAVLSAGPLWLSSRDDHGAGPDGAPSAKRQADAGLPDPDDPRRRHADALEHVHHCQIGKFRPSLWRINKKKNSNHSFTSFQYFVDYKLSQNYTSVESEYGTYFLSYVGFASQIPNLLFNWLNIFMNLG